MPAGFDDRLMGYADRLSARPGEAIRFKVSAKDLATYRADIVRLYCASDDPAGPGFREARVNSPVSGAYSGRSQPIHAGSCAVVPENERTARIASLTVQAYIWPTLPGRGPQAILGTWSQGLGAGFALVLEDDGSLGLKLGARSGAFVSVSTGVPVPARAWSFVAATYDAATREAVLIHEVLDPAIATGRPALVGAKLDGARADGGRALVMAAWNESQRPGQAPFGAHFNGRIEAPRLADRALDLAAIQALAKPIPPLGLGDAIIGCWDFARDIGSTRVIDVGPARRHGATVNLPTRAVRGHRWTGAELNWRYAPEQYAAIHFHDDDLYDCGWTDDFALTVPHDWPCGIYAARLHAEEVEAYIPFYVRPYAGAPTAPALFVMPTATHMAYANGAKSLDDEATEAAKGGFLTADPRSVYLAEHLELGGSLYDHHRDGSGIAHASRLRPMLDARPKAGLWTFDADSLIPAWLDAIGQDCDIVTDEDLDAEGAALLAPYRVVLTGRQPEYVSTRMWDAFAGYLAKGGRLMYLGGNGFYWRIAFHPDVPGVIEVRRPEGGVRAWSSAPGEGYHAFSGEPGGLWRRLGRAPNRLVGVGFTAQGFDVARPYRARPAAADPRAAFALEGLASETFGDHGAFGGAAGIEIDRADVMLGTPPHALVLARAEGFSENWRRVAEEYLTLHPMIDGTTNELTRSDVTFFETPSGGAVFSVGSIAWTASLATNGYQNDIARVTGNVLRRFLDPAPFVMPEIAPKPDPDLSVPGAADIAEGQRRRE
jgi:N,N-dimethylformamidase